MSADQDNSPAKKNKAAIRKRAERRRRSEGGMKRVEVWIPNHPDAVALVCQAESEAVEKYSQPADKPVNT